MQRCDILRLFDKLSSIIDCLKAWYLDHKHVDLTSRLRGFDQIQYRKNQSMIFHSLPSESMKRKAQRMRNVPG